MDRRSHRLFKVALFESGANITLRFHSALETSPCPAEKGIPTAKHHFVLRGGAVLALHIAVILMRKVHG